MVVDHRRLTPPQGFFYATGHPDVEIAPAAGVTHISQINDASAFAYEPDWSAGPIHAGEIVVFHSLTTGYYGAFRIDDILGQDSLSARANVTWYLQENGSADFSSFVFADGFESGDLSSWSTGFP